MSVKSFFKQVGVDLLKVLSVGEKAALVAEPVVDLLFAPEATLYNGAVAEIGNLLSAGKAAAAGTTGTVPEISAVASAVEPQLIAYAETLGLPAPTAAHINAYAQAVLEGLAVLQSLETSQPVPAITSAAAKIPAPVVAIDAPVAAATSGVVAEKETSNLAPA